METNLQNHPRFQALSPEAQQIALSKYNAMAPEAKAIVDKKLYTQPEEVRNEKPLKDVGSEAVLETAVAGPVLQGIGKGLKGGMAFLKKPGEAEMRLAGEELMSKFQPGGATNKLRTLAETMLEGPTKAVEAGKKAIMDVGIEHQAKRAGLETMKKEAGQAMGQIETKLGAEFKSTPEFELFIKDPKKVAKFSQQMERIGSMSPDELAAKHSFKDLQMWRKTAQEASKSGNISELGNASLQKGREVAAKAMEVQSKEFGLARDTYKGVVNKLDQLPLETKARQVALRKYVLNEQTKLSSIKQDLMALKKAATQADKEEAAAIKQKVIKMLREGQEQDRKIKYLKWAGLGIATTGLAGGFKKAIVRQ